MSTSMHDIEARLESGSQDHGTVTIPRQKLRDLVKMLAYSVSLLQNDIELDEVHPTRVVTEGGERIAPREAQNSSLTQPDVDAEIEDDDEDADGSGSGDEESGDGEEDADGVDNDVEDWEVCDDQVASPEEIASLRHANMQDFEALRGAEGVSKNISLDPWRCLSFIDWGHYGSIYTVAESYPDVNQAMGAPIPPIVQYLSENHELRATIQKTLFYGLSRWTWNTGRHGSWTLSNRGSLDMGPWIALMGMRIPGHFSGKTQGQVIPGEKLKELVRLKILQLLLELPQVVKYNGCSNPQKEGAFWGDILTVGQVLNQCYALGILNRPGRRDLKGYQSHLAEILKTLEISNLWHMVNSYYPWEDIKSVNELAKIPLSDHWYASYFIDDNEQNPSSKFESFHSREMSLELLRKVGNLEVKWTEYMTEHLVLDLEYSTLKIFWFGFTAMASPITHMGCKEYEFPWCHKSHPAQSQIFNELSETYSLLFRSQKNTPQEDMSQYGLLPIPQWLRVFYGDHRGTLSAHQAPNMSYFLQAGKPRVSDIEYHLLEINAKLPATQLFEKYKIWGDRLRELKAHMDSQKPGGIRGLWADKRDSLQWYTFWAVIIVGGASVILSVLGLMVSIVQTVGTFKGLE